MSLQNQWHILRGEMKYGPYEYGAMISMLQSGELQDYNYIWAPHLESWTLLSELSDFSSDRLLLLSQDESMKEFFNRREHERVDVKLPVYGHNNQNFFDGEISSISLSGAMILLNSPLLLPGQEITLHLRQSANNSEAINLKAQIIRKNFTKNRINVKSGLNYVVRFLQLTEPIKQKINRLIEDNRSGGNKHGANSISK